MNYYKERFHVIGPDSIKVYSEEFRKAFYVRKEGWESDSDRCYVYSFAGGEGRYKCLEFYKKDLTVLEE